MKRFTTILMSLMFVSSMFGQTVKIGAVDYPTIQEAIAAAADGDVIDISGVHTEMIAIAKNITLRGTDPATDIIQAAASAGSATGRVVHVVGIIQGNDRATDVTIENLTIRYGNSIGAHGGGILADKVKGLLTFSNVTISQNFTDRNGGGINTGGSNVNFDNCTIENNTATGANTNVGKGGGMFITPNNDAVDAVINVKNSVISNNSASNNSGGFEVNGNKGFGNNFTITANFENVTIASNQSAGLGGAGFVVGADYLGNNGVVTTGEANATLKMVHCTVAYNTSSADVFRSGLAFLRTVGATTDPNFSLYNSIFVSADDLTEKAIHFANTNTGAVVNSVLGAIEAAPELIDNFDSNNQKGRTSTEAGIAASLSDEGGLVKVLKLVEGASAIDFCTASTGITLPLADARGFARDVTPDAGAYEFGTLTALKDISTESPISVYPNPAITSFKVDAENQVVAISLFDISGQLVKQVFNSSEMNVAGINAGLYLVEVKTESTSFVSKLVIK